MTRTEKRSDVPDLAHVRHKPLTQLVQQRELIVVVPQLRSNVNLSRIVRVAGCCGIERIIACGQPKIDPKIARDGAETVALEVRRSPAPVLKRLRQEGFQVEALEQTTGSRNLHEFRFRRRTALVLGHERTGVDETCLNEVDMAVEIPVYGRPYSYNVATATAMVLYEYCRQFPQG